jgi:hypothetical protein
MRCSWAREQPPTHVGAAVAWGEPPSEVALPVLIKLDAGREPQQALWDALLEAVALYEDRHDPEPSFHGSGGVD